MFDLTGKLAVVTGARRGIGLAMATSLAQAGADVVGISASMEETDSPVRRAVEGAGRIFTALKVDFNDRDAVDAAAATLLADHGAIDILVNNAGTISRAPAMEHGDDRWDQVLEVNVTGAFRFSRALAPAMAERGRGKIIFTASMLSYQGGVNVASYTASKHAVAGLVKALANEWAPLGINVNAIAPGYIRTDNTQALQDDEQRNASILERIPAGRWGEADDLAGATVFLASEASDYVHGILLPVDGGWLGR